MVRTDLDDGRGRAGRARPLLQLGLVLAAVAVVLALLLVHRARRTGPPAAPPSASDPEELVAGWAGELPGTDGARLVASLAPLHADPERQAFDARALARRLRLGEGEPWRLELRWIPEVDVDPDAAEAADRAATAEAPMPERWGLGLGGVRVSDGRGTALATVPAPAEGAPDPLRTVLAPPAEPLYPGQAVDLVLWGRAPEGGAELDGLLPEDDELRASFRAATGLERPFVLEARGLPRSELRNALARTERAAAVRAPAPVAGQAADLRAPGAGGLRAPDAGGLRAPGAGRKDGRR